MARKSVVIKSLAFAVPSLGQLTESSMRRAGKIAELRHELAQECHATAARAVVDAFERLKRNSETILH